MSDLRELIMNFGIELSAGQEAQFMRFEALLLEWNEKMNLTAITAHEDILVKHFMDSVSAVAFLGADKFNGLSVIDVGTGAGFPGIPLKIAFPAIKRMTLLDSLNKRVTFLNEAASLLGIDSTGTECIHMRAEDAARDTAYREKYDLAVSRAVAPLNVLVEYALPFVRPGGFFIAYKGGDVTAEASSALNAVSKLGGSLPLGVDYANGGIVNVKLPGDITHSLVCIKKLRHTELKYPRNSAKIAKTPLL